MLVHDETNRTLAQLLLAMAPPEFPVALGVILRQPGESFEKAYYANQSDELERTARVADVLRQTSTWRRSRMREEREVSGLGGAVSAATRSASRHTRSKLPLQILAYIGLFVAAGNELARDVDRFAGIRQPTIRRRRRSPS